MKEMELAQYTLIAIQSSNTYLKSIIEGLTIQGRFLSTSIQTAVKQFLMMLIIHSPDHLE